VLFLDRLSKQIEADMKPTFNFTRRQWLASAFGFLVSSIAAPLAAQIKIRRIQTQYIAALAPEGATSGTGAETWGLWKVDPGPIGVWLRFYQALQKAGNIAPSAAVKPTRTRSRLLALPKSMRSIIDATRREQRYGSA
jgi:hypothetical protein